MGKFKRKLEGEIVPEWREAYVNYELLKKDIQQIIDRRTGLVICKVPNHPHGIPLKPLQGQSLPWPPDRKIMIGQCNRVELCCTNLDEVHRFYETEDFEEVGLVDEYDETFFSRFDSQLYMVNKFYMMKEMEYLLQLKKLEEQMEILLCKRRELLEISPSPSSWSSCIKAVATEENGCTMACWVHIHSNYDAKKRKLSHAEKMLRTAFIEYYRSLTFLRDYSGLNRVAFEKILKKYDKITGQQASSTYFQVLECSYFSNSVEVMNLMGRVEDLFTDHLNQKNRRQAMELLSPSPQRSSDDKSLCLGLCTCLWLLILAFVFILNHPQALNPLKQARFTRSILIPIFSTMVLFLLHIYMYGFNVYLWRRVGINSTLIFELPTASLLRRNEVMLLSTSVAGVLLGSTVGHLFLRPKLEANLNTALDMILIGVFVVVLASVFLPLNICYRTTRFIFIRCIWRVICSPFYKVEFSDFFLADQLTSQIIALRNLAKISSICMGRYSKNPSIIKWTENNTILPSHHIVAVLPYWWRLMQCVRRWLDEKDQSQLVNGGKYLSALTAVWIRLTHDPPKKGPWLELYITSSVIASIYQFYWDVVMDWGLLQPRSVNPWLRDQLMLKRKTLYFISMAVNALLRFAWLCKIIFPPLRFIRLSKESVDIILAMVEIGRRFLWNFYRLEKEHLSNGGKFRVVKTAPLPFRDIDLQADEI